MLVARAEPCTVVISGTDQGGFQVAAPVRQKGFGSPVILVGDESHLPYQRRCSRRPISPAGGGSATLHPAFT